jgi:hypothetical protein
MEKWLNKFDISSPEDVHDLERSSAVNQFHRGMDRPTAEQMAYDNYKRIQHCKAAAYHLDGVTKSSATGDNESKNKHHIMFNLHLAALGISPFQAVPPEIQAFRGQNTEQLTKFKSHQSDLFVMGK